MSDGIHRLGRGGIVQGMSRSMGRKLLGPRSTKQMNISENKMIKIKTNLQTKKSIRENKITNAKVNLQKIQFHSIKQNYKSKNKFTK